jgi:hypothetical protein
MDLAGKIFLFKANQEPESFLVAFRDRRSQRCPPERKQSANVHEDQCVARTDVLNAAVRLQP